MFIRLCEHFTEKNSTDLIGEEPIYLIFSLQQRSLYCDFGNTAQQNKVCVGTDREKNPQQIEKKNLTTTKQLQNNMVWLPQMELT